MTARSGQNGRSARVTSVVAAAALLAAVAVSSCGTSAAKAATVLTAARGASVQLAGGVVRVAAVGMTVPPGATVVTEPGGSAALTSSDRVVLLGSDTAVLVRDGLREALRRGLVMVDARRTVGLILDAGAATVQAAPGSLARVERGVLLRAAAFRGALSVRATGRRSPAAVTGLHQVQVPDGGDPGRVTPLALTGDGWERRFALDLVTADEDLVALAAGLDRDAASSSVLLSVAPASYFTAAPRMPGEARSESALAVALAGAVPAAADRRVSVFRTVRALRADGGSWGVVAALVGADVAAVSATLDGTLSQAAASTAPPAVGSPATGGARIPTSRPVGPVLAARSSPSAIARPRSSAHPTPRPTPSRSSDPIAQVVTTVVAALPSPTPLSAGPAPVPVASVRVGGASISVG